MLGSPEKMMLAMSACGSGQAECINDQCTCDTLPIDIIEWCMSVCHGMLEHLWHAQFSCLLTSVPFSCRTMQHASAEAQPPNTSASQHLAALVMRADATALDSCNQHEWGPRRKGALNIDTSLYACCPALWQVYYVSSM